MKNGQYRTSPVQVDALFYIQKERPGQGGHFGISQRNVPSQHHTLNTERLSCLKSIKIIVKGKAACRLHRESSKDYI